MRIAEEESRVPPVAPSGSRPAVQVPGVGDFVSLPKKVIKSTFRKRASLRLTESRSSVFAKLSKLSSQELLKLSEQCSDLAKDRDPDLGMDESALPATEEDDVQGMQLG